MSIPGKDWDSDAWSDAANALNVAIGRWQEAHPGEFRFKDPYPSEVMVAGKLRSAIDRFALNPHAEECLKAVTEELPDATVEMFRAVLLLQQKIVAVKQAMN